MGKVPNYWYYHLKDVYDVIMEGGRKLSSKYVKNSGSTAMFTNIRKIDEIQGKGNLYN